MAVLGMWESPILRHLLSQYNTGTLLKCFVVENKSECDPWNAAMNVVDKLEES